MKLVGIYSITNTINNKIYIGYSKDIRKRLREHSNRLSAGKHPNAHLQESFNKYGNNNFLFELLEECDEKFLTSQENYWCNILNTYNRKFGYNLLLTNPNEGVRKFSNETKLKMSRTKIGTKRPELHKINMEVACLDRKDTLDSNELKQIRDLLRNPYRNVTNLAKMFGVSRSTISNIKHGRTWKNTIV